MKEHCIDSLLNRALSGQVLGRDEIITILSIEDKSLLKKLFSTARKIRESVFSNKIFMYGFVYFSNYCRNNCNFCYSRRTNNINRYRKSIDEIVGIAEKLTESGVHLIDLTMGEDTSYYKEDYKPILDIVNRVKTVTNLPVMISPGVIDKSLINELCNLGVEWFALYQETHSKELFNKLRIDQSYDERMNTKLYAKEKGMLLEEGILVGIGESIDDIADSILEMGKMKADQVRVMSFVPQEGIPMKDVVSPNRNLELKIIAILRLMYPYALIPASLDVDGISGLKSRMNSGANVVTSIIPPEEGLMGVAQNVKDVDDGNRSVPMVVSILSEMGLVPATNIEFKTYINNRTNKND